MKRTLVCRFLPLMALVASMALLGCTQPAAMVQAQSNAARIDRDLADVSISQLRSFYAEGRYTVTQVTQWHLDRIARYDSTYKSFLHVDSTGALSAAAAADALKKSAGSQFTPPPLWGIPVVIKGNTSVKGFVTSNGWKGYLIPGQELTAPADATIVTKLRNAGAVILGHTNLPDFASSDTTISSAGGRTGNAYNWRFSPGGSSGGTATAVAASFAVLGTGTDTSNSIRLPSGASALVGVLPTRGLVSINGIHPLDWLLDNAGPMARNVTDAAIALTVMAGEDTKDFRTRGSSTKAQSGPYTQYLKRDALRGKRFGVPSFIMRDPELRQETRVAFQRAVEGLRSAGATVVVDDAILPRSFETLTNEVSTRTFLRDGLERFLQDFGPSRYRSSGEYEKSVGAPIPFSFLSGPVRNVETDPAAETLFFAPQRKALAAFQEALERFRLDGFVYPALQMPPNDETIPQPGGGESQGPHTRTGWTNTIGVPAVVVPGGFYSNGLPFGIEFSTRPWRDGDLLGWAYAYEQTTQHRKPPTLTSGAK